MKRDWDLIRAILEAVEAKSPGQVWMAEELKGYDVSILRSHVAMLQDAGFLRGKAMRGSGDLVLAAHVDAITYNGYDLLATIRSKAVWERVKTTARDKGLELTFEVIKALGAAAIQSVISGGS